MARTAYRKALLTVERSRMSLWGIIKYLGLQNNILFCLDAGAVNGVEANTETSWLDLSGNGNHWISGTATDTSTGNPRFNGTPGRMSEQEYWSGKGNSADAWFTAPTAVITNSNAWHKNNGVFSYIGVFDPTSLGVTNFRCMGNSNAFTTAMDEGVELVFLPGSSVFRFVIDLGTGATDATVTSLTATGQYTVGKGPYQPIFGGVAYDEATTSLRMRCNSFTTTATPAASVNVTNPASSLRLGAQGTAGAGLSMDNSQKYYMAAVWSRQLTDAEMKSLYYMLKQNRFPSMR